MKIAANFVVSLAALGALLGAGVSHATDIAVLPLKASVLAKPNVVFGMDESGSMDAEVMIDGNYQGFVYGNYGNAVMYPGNKLRTGSAASDWAIYYLFPNGIAAGEKVNVEPNAAYGYNIPPVPEMAWTRSSDYNSLYYDDTRTYKPWSPAYVNGASTSFAAANPAAARSHPTNGNTTLALTSNFTGNGVEARFTFLAGMTIPVGAGNPVCYFATFPGTLPYTVPTTRGLCKATITYYPATFWKKENCPTVGADCVVNFDGVRLKRYEIKSSLNIYPSGRDYAGELKNFANWYTYYRKRRLMLGAAMGEVLENMTGLRMGVVAFNANTPPKMYDADDTNDADNNRAVSGLFYKAEGSGGTPTHTTMAYIHNQFDTNTNIIQYACQRNSSFIITDGFANDAAVAPPAYNAATYGTGAPYQTTHGSSLADKALAYFTLRLRQTSSPLTAGRVPLGDQTKVNPDPNSNLHLTTYALTLGMKGTLWPTAVDPFTTAPTWPAPVSNTPSMIDDLWHATINGRGQMYGSNDAAGTASAIRAGLLDILSQTGAQSSIAVTNPNLQRGDSRAYHGIYNPAGWTGDLTANAIDKSTGNISATPAWSASSKLLARAWTDRVIASHNGAVGVPFTAGNVGALVDPAGALGNPGQLIDYLRGDRSLEGTTYRSRSSLMGAVINAEPFASREDGIVYVASGEGMLHAIDTQVDPGKELWAFVPHAVLPEIGKTASRSYTFKTKLDGGPVIGRAGPSTRLLVAGMGSAGRSYYAIDVTSPRGLSEAQLASNVRWEFPASSGDGSAPAKVGQTLGQPTIVRVTGGSYSVLVTSGYNSKADGKGRLWMVDPANGTIQHEFTVPAGVVNDESGLAHVTGFVEDDGSVRYVYGGDLLGNLWRFDLVSKTAPYLMAVLKDAAGNLQPVTAPPELMYYEAKRIVLVGTGKLLDIIDFGKSDVQSFYAIADDGSTLPNARAALMQQTYTKGTDAISNTTLSWKTDRGWYMDLPAGEQANTRPKVDQGLVSFVTNYAKGSDCTAASYLYVLNVLNATKSADISFIGKTLSAISNSSGVTLVQTSDGSTKGLTQTYDGAKVNTNVAPPAKINASKNAWRDVRR